MKTNLFRLPSRRSGFRPKAAFFCLLVLAALCRVAATAAEPKPDIIVILSDDQGSYDVSWRGSEIKTPNLDKLAASGAKLEQFYVQPLCSPTRAALLTGRYPMRYGLQVGVVRPWANYGLPLEERLLPQALKEVGYTTAICGKWHLGSFDKAYFPHARGFDHSYGHLLGALDYFTHVRDGKDDWYRDDVPLKEEGYSTHLIAREAARLVVNGAAADPADDDAPPQNASPRPRAKTDADKMALFNLAADPSEKTDLSDKQPERLKELRRRYDALAQQAAPPKNVKP